MSVGQKLRSQVLKRSMYLPLRCIPTATAGCADLAAGGAIQRARTKVLRLSTQALMRTLSSPCVFLSRWNEGTVTFQAFWTVTGTNTGTVAWGLSGGCIADDASINTAFGTNVVATAKAFSGTSNDMTVSATSGAVTIANAAVDTMAYFQIMRDVSADSQSGDARLLGIKLFFTTDAANDA
jgi:flavin-binding protein dodecin